MFERFTDRARRVVVFAQEEARLLNHNHIGTEHLLLGLIREGEGVAPKALESLGISLEAVRREVEAIIGEGTTVPTGHIPFTPRSKKVLELALREAVELGHQYLGTEHILLGLLREGRGVAAQVLRKLGADPEPVRQRVIELLSKAEGAEAEEAGSRYASPVFERFTEKARRVIVLAQEESRELSHDHIGTEHLLLAMIREEDGIAGKALAEAGITLDDARKKVEELAPKGEPEPKRRSGKRWRRHVDFTKRAKKTMELSLRESLGLGHNYIGTEHLLLGLLTLGEGTGVDALSSLGGEPDKLRESVLALTESQPEEQKQPREFREADFEIREAVPEEASSPRCPRCRSDLAETAAVRALDLPLHEGEGARAVTFAFCRRCGTWLGTVAG